MLVDVEEIKLELFSQNTTKKFPKNMKSSNLDKNPADMRSPKSSNLNMSTTSQKTKIRLESSEIESVRDKLMVSVRRRMPSSSFKPFERAQRFSFNGSSFN